MTVRVRYVTLHEEQPAIGFWDQEVLTRPTRWLGDDHAEGLDGVDAADPLMVVVPGRMNWEREPELASMLARFERMVLVVTGDEEGRFDPVAAAPHARGWWFQMPHADPAPAEVLPLGAPPHAWSGLSRPHAERDLEWCFAGQVTHERRRQLVAALLDVPHGLLLASDRFAMGVEPDAYARLLGRARVVPCPGGPQHPETFRLYEAIEAGAVPLVERSTADGRDWTWLWERLGIPAGLTVDSWDGVGTIIGSEPEGGWQRAANRLQAMWAWRSYDLAAQVRVRLDVAAPEVTSIVTMSPIPSHPSLEVLEETLRSIRDNGPSGPVIVCCDGPRPVDDVGAYEEAVRRLCDRCLHDPAWANVLPLIAEDWQHQANMIRLALDRVESPVVLVVEHDTPLVDAPVPWAGLVAAVRSGEANVVRLHHEASILDAHRHLVLDDSPIDICGVPMVRTIQWSQRPSLASAAYYRRLLADHFPVSCRGFVEDHVYSVVEQARWEDHRVAIYHPAGDIKRSTHLDGRAGAEKAPAYIS